MFHTLGGGAKRGDPFGEGAEVHLGRELASFFILGPYWELGAANPGCGASSCFLFQARKGINYFALGEGVHGLPSFILHILKIISD